MFCFWLLALPATKESRLAIKPPPNKRSKRKEQLIRTLNLLAEKVDGYQTIRAKDLSPVEEDKKARNAEHTQLASQYATRRSLNLKEAYPREMGAKKLPYFGIKLSADAAMLAVKVQQKGRLFLS
jgi:UDP-galactopyranose mutase